MTLVTNETNETHRTYGPHQAAGFPAPPYADTGILAPVRAATPIEAVVSDDAWLQAMLDAESALARAQARLGVVPESAAAAITEAARLEYFDPAALAERARGAGNPVVAVVEALTAVVASRVPDAADYVHRGSTSQDVLDTATMLVAGRALAVILGDLERTAAALAGLAQEYRDTAMPGRTLTQHAVPTTFGLKAAGWLQGVLDACQRLGVLAAWGLPAELGGAAGTMAGYVEFARIDSPDGAAFVPERYVDQLLHAYAAELGLAVPVAPWHTARTPIAELGAALALTSGVLGKIAVDVQSLSRTEVGEVSEPIAPGRGVSSAMPQKVNPVLATLIRTAAAQVPLLAAGLAQGLVAEDERPGGAWHAEWQPLREAFRLVGGAAHTAAELTAGLTVHPDRMRENLGVTGGLIVAERLAAVLAPALGKAAARAAVTRASHASVRDRRPLGAVLAADPEVAAHFTAEALAELTDPTGYLGAAGLLVDRVLERHRGFWSS